MTKWIRADHAQAEKEAAVAAEREACANVALRYFGHEPSDDEMHTVVGIADHIRARSDTGAQAALEAVKREARAEALREADGSFFALCVEGTIEADRAMKKFPQPNHVISKVAEEAREVVKAAIHCAEGREKPQEVRSEIKQLIAMLYRLWVEGDQVHGLSALIPADQEGNE